MEWLKQFFDLRRNAATYEEINDYMRDNIKVSIDNVIILSSAIVIASIGLNLNSIPVIIGAMLISPVMSPLLTIAYSIVIRDRRLFNKSLRRLILYVIVAVVISTIYFKITFLKDPTPELIARTNPTIFDILIAVFGGVAGIVGITRKEKSNVIPGVAIATALMPPLCTVGYGIANYNFTYIFNAFILFLTNAYFIVIASVVVLFFMKFHKVNNIDVDDENLIRRFTFVILGIILIGTLFNTHSVIAKTNVERSLENYIAENINTEEDTLVWDTRIDYANNKIMLVVSYDLSNAGKNDIKEFISHQRFIKNFEIDLIYEKVDRL